jgi:hypothetical protein
MFPIQMTAQRDKPVAALGAVVSNVDEIDNVVPLLEQLGRDYRRFSVRPRRRQPISGALTVSPD